MPNSVLLQDHTMLFTPAYKALVPCVALVLTWLVSILSASRPATLNQGLEKIQADREYDFAPVHPLSPTWEKEFLAPSMARSTAEAFNIVCCLDRNGKLDVMYHRTRSRRLPLD